jgi:hypothetical protein
VTARLSIMQLTHEQRTWGIIRGFSANKRTSTCIVTGSGHRGQLKFPAQFVRWSFHSTDPFSRRYLSISHRNGM